MLEPKPVPTVGFISAEGTGGSPSRGDPPANDTNEDLELTIVPCTEAPATSPRNTEPSVFCTPESTPTKHRRRTYPAGAHPFSTIDRNYAHPTPSIEDGTEFYDIGTPPVPSPPTLIEDITCERRRLRTPPRGRRPRKKLCPTGCKCEESAIVPHKTTTTTPLRKTIRRPFDTPAKPIPAKRHSTNIRRLTC